ncbi:DAP1 protein, partial [Atractosteus spatula]|nr:DAP1 protein [Atractosteus spatula]
MSSPPKEKVETKAGHLPAVKAGGMRIVQKHQGSGESAQDRDKDSKEYESSSSEVSPGHLKNQSVEFHHTVQWPDLSPTEGGVLPPGRGTPRTGLSSPEVSSQAQSVVGVCGLSNTGTSSNPPEEPVTPGSLPRRVSPPESPSCPDSPSTRCLNEHGLLVWIFVFAYNMPSSTHNMPCERESGRSAEGTAAPSLPGAMCTGSLYRLSSCGCACLFPFFRTLRWAGALLKREKSQDITITCTLFLWLVFCHSLGKPLVIRPDVIDLQMDRGSLIPTWLLMLGCLAYQRLPFKFKHMLPSRPKAEALILCHALMQSPPKPTLIISGAVAKGDKDFPPAAAQVAHQKPQPSVEKLPPSHHINQHIHQPRK